MPEILMRYRPGAIFGKNNLNISDTLPLRSPMGYDTPDNAIGYAMHSSRSHDDVIRVYDDAGNVIGTHEHKGDF